MKNGFGYRDEHRPTFVLALILAIVVASLAACASNATPQRKAYTAISDTVAAGTAAMKAFNERYQAGLQTEEDRTKVLAGWASFQSQIHFAEALAKDPNRVSDPVSLATDAVGQLLNLIATLAPKRGMRTKETPGIWLARSAPPRLWLAGGAR